MFADLLPLEGAIDARRYGARPDTGADMIVPLQRAQDAANAAGRPLYLPSGEYVISEPFWVTGTASKTTAGAFAL